MTIPFSNVLPFMGVVQEQTDISGTGRCKVRCFGFHPPSSDTSVDVTMLPWAIVLSNGGVQSPDIRPGELVFGFFLDGRDAQYPVVVGTIPGHSTGLLANCWADASAATIHRAVELATGSHHTGFDAESHPLVATSASRKISEDSSGGYTVTTPDLMHSGSKATSINSDEYNGAYVIAAKEHCTMQHKGTVVQIQSDGSVVIHSTGDTWNVTNGSAVDVSERNKDIIVKSGQFNIKVNGSCNIHVNGDMNHKVTGDYNLSVGGKMNIIAGEQLELQGAKASIHAYEESLNMSATTEMNIASKNISFGSQGGDTVGPDTARTPSGEIFIKGGKSVYFELAENLNFTSGGEVRVSTKGDIGIATEGKTVVSAKSGIELSSDNHIYADSKTSVRVKGDNFVDIKSDKIRNEAPTISLKSSDIIAMDATSLIDMQNGSSLTALSPTISDLTTPELPTAALGMCGPTMSDLKDLLLPRAVATEKAGDGMSAGAPRSTSNDGLGGVLDGTGEMA